MSNENNYQEGNNKDYVYSIRLRAGKRRTYFFDVRTTRANDYFLTITESKRRFDDNGYERHKIFLYKEDFNKFRDALEEATDYVKTELLPDYDFDQFSHRDDQENQPSDSQDADTVTESVSSNEENASVDEQVDKW